MTSKERVREAVQHRETDRLPLDFAARPEIVRALFRHFRTGDGEALLRTLNVDLRGVGPSPRYTASPHAYADPTARVGREPKSGVEVFYDIWGVGFVRKQAMDGEYLDLFSSPLRDKGSLDDLAAYPFPTPDLWSYGDIEDQCARYGQYGVWAHSRGFFEIAWFMRSMEQFLMDLMLSPDYAEVLMDRIVAYLEERTVRILEQDRQHLIDFVEINDDVGGQQGLLLSPDLWRAFVKPRMARMIRRFKAFGVYIRYHCCGGLRDIIPDLIDIGVDILNPVQPCALGMDLEGLKRDFGDRLTFDGGIDTQELLPHKRGREFEDELRPILRFMGRRGGFVAGPSHAIQVDVPLENVLKLYEVAALPYGEI